jgi:predicted RNase H-like HicB family nuclease
MKYAVVIEKAESNYCAYVPDLPGCVATGSTRQECLKEMEEAIAFHSDEMKLAGLPIPQPSATTQYVEVAAVA